MRLTFGNQDNLKLKKKKKPHVLIFINFTITIQTASIKIIHVKSVSSYECMSLGYLSSKYMQKYWTMLLLFFY